MPISLTTLINKTQGQQTPPILPADALFAPLVRAPMQAVQTHIVQPYLHDVSRALFSIATQGLSDAVRAQTQQAMPTFFFHIDEELLRGAELGMCDRAARKMHEDDEDWLQFFTTYTLEMPSTHTVFVAVALWKSKWRSADRPCAYVRNVARRLYAHDVKKNTLLIDTSNHRSYDVALLPMEAAVSAPLLLADRDLALDLDLACEQGILSPDQRQLLEARRLKYTRRDVGAYLRWDQRKVEAVWKSLQRACPALRQWLG